MKLRIIVKAHLSEDEAAQQAEDRHLSITSMLTDLDQFKSSVYTECFSVNLTPESASQATNNIQNIKDSLDSWRESVKMRLDEVDALCRTSADIMAPEQYSQLREARHQLAENYENIVRTVEGVYGRLNVITVLLMEFSTGASATQSWITECTRLAGSIKAKSADSNAFSETQREALALLERVQTGEGRLKEIGTIVRKLEHEINLLYEEAPAGTPRSLNSDDVNTTLIRVQDDYDILLKQCQELLQFQNRLKVLAGDVDENKRKLDDMLGHVESSLGDFDESRGMSADAKIRTLEALQSKARDIDDKVDQSEQATLRFLALLEGSGVPDDIREEKQVEIADRKKRQTALVDRLQQRMNRANVELAENEGVREAAASLAAWANDFEKKASASVILPLDEQKLQELKRDCQQLQSELESRQVVLGQLENEAARLVAGGSPEGPMQSSLAEAKQKMNKCSALLMGLRDNIHDTLVGEQSFTMGAESLGRSCDILSSAVKSTAPRDLQRLDDCEEELVGLESQLDGLCSTATMLKSIPNTSGLEKMDKKIGDFHRRIKDIKDDLQTKRDKSNETAGLEKHIMELRQNAAEWLGAFDGELMELGPVSIDLNKLAQQRKACGELSDKHKEGLALLEELDAAAAKLQDSEGAGAGNRFSSVPRHVIDLMTRLNGQADLLRNRVDKINQNEQKAAELEEARNDLLNWIDGQDEVIVKLGTPSTKDELQNVSGQIERLEKNARQERRRFEDIHLKSRELSRRASLPEEAANTMKEDELIETKWSAMQDNLEDTIQKNKKIGQLLDGCGQLEKWLAGKERMVGALGAPSTEAAVARSQIAQIQIMKSETDAEQSALESLLEGVKQVAGEEDETNPLVKRIATLQRRWKSFDDGLLCKEAAVKKADALSQDLKKLQKEIKSQMGEIESTLDKTANLPSGEIDKQLLALEDVKRRHSDLGEVVKELEEKLRETEELDIDPTNKDEIAEQVEKVRRRIGELGQKIDVTKTAALAALNEGAAVDDQLNAILSVVRGASAEVQQFPPIVADSSKLAEQLAAVNTLYNNLLAKEGEVPVVKSLVAKQLKKKHDPELKSKCDELSKTWNPLLNATRDRKSAVEKADDLIKQFNDAERALSGRLRDDEKEIEEVVTSEDGDAVLHALQAVENVLARRTADAEALIGLVDRIELVAPGPDANKLKRKAENLIDDCKAVSRKAKAAAGVSKKKADLRERLERTLSDSKDFIGNQEKALENNDNINKDRIIARIAEVTDFWNRKQRDINNCIDELKEAGGDIESQEKEVPVVAERFDTILGRLNDVAQRLSERQEAANRLTEKANKAANEANTLHTEINDLENPAFCKEDLCKQKEEIAVLTEDIDSQKKALDNVRSELDKALDEGIVSRPQWEAANSALDNAEKLLTRCQKKLEQREKKIDQTAGEVYEFEKESKVLADELTALLNNGILSSPVEVGDLKKQSTELKQLKDSAKSLGDRVDAFSSDCKVLIKAAGPDANTIELDNALQRVADGWSAVSSALADREMRVDNAAQQLGRYEDAYKALLNWLEDTEELLENQDKPSVDAKAAKLQLATYHLMMKHIEDKEASFTGFNGLIDKLVEMASNEGEKNSLKEKANSVWSRYQRLLGDAQEKQGRLMEAIDLAERLSEIMVPLSSWLTKTEKRVQGLSNIATASAKMEEQLAAQKALEEEIDQKADDVATMDSLVPMLCALVSVKDAEELEVQANHLGNTYDSLASRVHSIRDILADVATQVGDFEHDTNALAGWLEETEARLLDMDELAIEPDDLLEQSILLTELAEAVTERDALVSNVVSVGKMLSKQTTTDEAIALQNRVEALKMRYVDMMAVADEKLALLSKAIPLSERFHEGFDVVMQWVEAVEEDLHHLDEADISTQAQLVFTLEEDIQNWRPEVEELVAVSNQLQALSSPDRAEELYQNTVEMNRRVNQIADKVSRRAERLDVTEKQSREVMDDLEFTLEWLTDARERLLTADPPSIDPEFLGMQLKNQKMMNEDVVLNKGKLRDVINEAKKIVRQIGGDDDHAVSGMNERCDHAKELVDEVTNLCMERTEHLERAKVLAEQLTLEFEELSGWLDDLDDQLRTAPDVNTTTPQAELQKMNQHNSELMAAIVAYKPIIDHFDLDVKGMMDVCSEKEGEKLRELADELLTRYKELAGAVRARGQGIDSVMDTTSVFEERLEKLVQNLEGAADRLRENTGTISADPVVLENRLAENAAILEELQSKKTQYATLREDAAALLANAPSGDIAAQDVMGKLDRLEKLWGDIEQEAAIRGGFLCDVLGKAKHFWSELDECQKAVDDLRYRLESVEPATGQPQQLQLQQATLAEVANEINTAGPRIAALRQAGESLSSVIPPEEQEVVRTQVDAVESGWSTITTLFAEKNKDLVEAMEEAMTFHGDLGMLLAWLDGAEKKLAALPPAEYLKVDEIPAHLEELMRFKDDVDQHGILKEKLAQTAAQLAEGSSAAQAAVVRQPISELNARWAKLYGAMADREHKVEKTLLQMGRLSDATNQLVDWIDRSRVTVGELASSTTPRNLRNVEIHICKLAVLRNDVDAHRPSVETLNAAAQRLLKDEKNTDAAGRIDEMNSKWRMLNNDIEDIGRQLEKAKSEAESVGGELERWLSWLEDVEQQLATTRPTGGLPDTAQTQLDDFRVLRAEIEQNASALEDYLKETGIYLIEHGNDQESWIGRSHVQMKTKWNKVKELCMDREKKLQLALQEAILLDNSIRATADWLTAAETNITNMRPVSHILEVAEKQNEELEEWKNEVGERKQLMAEQQAAGRRMQVYCEKKDAIPIKNGLVSLKHRFEKVVSRTNERAKHLAAAIDEARVWQHGVEAVEECLNGVEERLAVENPATSNVDRLREHLNEIKELQRQMSEVQPQFEITKKRGVHLAEHSHKAEAKIINAKNTEMMTRWAAVTRLCLDRQRAAEQAVLEGGAFDEAMKELEDWIDLELHRTQTDDYVKVHGDVDTVRDLVDEENHRNAERNAKKKGVNTVLRKADELADKGVEESDSVKEDADRLRKKWQKVEDAAAERAKALADAENEAAEFDSKAHTMLEWLAAIEQRLKEPVTDLSAALAVINDVKKDLDAERQRKDDCLAKGRDLAKKCHPRAEQALKHWTRVVDGRWKEVEERCAEREFMLLEEEQKEAERDGHLKELHEFIVAKREELSKMTSQPPANDLETLEGLEKEYEHFDFELRERQGDVDNAIKSARKGVRDLRGDQLSSEWKQLWLDSLGYHSALENQRALLEELKRLEGWRWEDWKERYVDWNDHGKARVSDLFRRIDRSHTGNVPRNVFIDAIIASKFPTSRLEMDKVADLFDKGDGMINSKDFINALRFDLSNRTKEPVTDNEKINVEIEKQRNTCACCQKYKIEKISDGHYKFGDTQIKRMVRILRSTVMVRVGGGWEALDEFLGKHDPCRAKGRLNINIYKDVAPAHAVDTMRAFTKGRHARIPQPGTPGPIMKVREKTERSIPMFPHRHERAPSDLSIADSRIPRSSLTASRSSLLDSASRPPSRASECDSERPTRIPSLRGKKGAKYNPPSSSKYSS